MKLTDHLLNGVFSCSPGRDYLLSHFIKKVALPLFLILTVHAASLADSLYEHRHYNLARIEYLREFFFYPSLRDDPHTRLRYALSVCHVNSREGIRELRSVQSDFDTLAPDIAIAVAKQYMALNDFRSARELFIATGEKMLAGYTLIMDNQLTDAHSLFTAMGQNDIAQDIGTFQHSPRKSPGTAGILSAICPGAGEIYAGNIEQGIKGFLLTVGSGFLIYNAIKKEKYIDAVLIFNFLFQRYYLGSIYNARHSTAEANIRYREKWLEHMKQTHFSDLDVSP